MEEDAKEVRDEEGWQGGRGWWEGGQGEGFGCEEDVGRDGAEDEAGEGEAVCLWLAGTLVWGRSAWGGEYSM